MATRYIDPNIQTPAASTGMASFYPAVLDALIASNNLGFPADATFAQSVSSAGAIPVTARVVAATVTGATAYTLANGTFAGQQITVYFLTGASIPNATITPATPLGYATVTALGAAGDSVTFLWTGAGWAILGAIGVTFT